MSEGKLKNNSIASARKAPERLKVLLLEDDPYYFELYTNRLRGGDFEVAAEADEDEGLKRALKYQPDVIILDISLPKEDDFVFISRLKENPKLASIPAIILTDLGDEDSRKKGLALGAADYLVRDEMAFADLIDSIKKYGGRK